jgi:hypothetical protein
LLLKLSSHGLPILLLSHMGSLSRHCLRVLSHLSHLLLVICLLLLLVHILLGILWLLWDVALYRINGCSSTLSVIVLKMLSSSLLSGRSVGVGEDRALERCLRCRTFKTRFGFDARNIALGRWGSKVLNWCVHRWWVVSRI